MDNDGAFGVMPGGSGASWHHVLMLRVAWIRDNDQFYIRMFFCAMKLYDQPDGLDDQEEEECHCEQIPAGWQRCLEENRDFKAASYLTVNKWISTCWAKHCCINGEFILANRFLAEAVVGPMLLPADLTFKLTWHVSAATSIQLKTLQNMTKQNSWPVPPNSAAAAAAFGAPVYWPARTVCMLTYITTRDVLDFQ